MKSSYRSRSCGAEVPQVAAKEERSVREVRKRRLNGKMRYPNRHPPCVAEMPQIGVKEEDARLACGARRLNGKMRCLSPAGVF